MYDIADTAYYLQNALYPLFLLIPMPT
jgi:hypothetical protein